MLLSGKCTTIPCKARHSFAPCHVSVEESSLKIILHALLLTDSCRSQHYTVIAIKYYYLLFLNTHIRVSNRSAGMISSRLPGDIFMKIQQNLQFYRHLPGRVTNPWDHTDPVYPSMAQLKDIYRGLIAPISINPGLLQDVLLVHCEVQEF